MNSLDSQIIYRKEYPRLTPMQALKMSEQKNSNRKTLPTLTFDELINRISANVSFTPLPERKESSKEFIRLAIEVSEIYEIDVKIERGADRITVEYYLNGGGWREINRVFGMADEIAFFKDTDGFDITVVLDYFTHATVRRGKVIHP